MRGWSASGTPIRSQMIATGSTEETSPTNSTSPLGAMASTIWRARRRTDSSAWATERGVNPRFTSDRSRVCLGGSVEIIDRIWKRSTSSASVITWMPAAELNVSQSRLAAAMSA